MEAVIREIPDRRAVCLQLIEDDAAISFEQFSAKLLHDAEFPLFFTKTLANSAFESFRWELPGLTKEGWTRSFECVLVESLELQTTAKSNAFEEHFITDQQVVSFSNLGGDAILVVPTPMAETDAYPHLAAFVRFAPTAQQHLLWQAVGEALEMRVGTKPVWLSTAGAGVPWLHVRLDDRPKYYSYGPYRELPKRRS